MAPAVLGFQERATEVRVTSVTSGLKGALGIRFGSVGLFGCTGTPNSKWGTDGGQEKEMSWLLCTLIKTNRHLCHLHNRSKNNTTAMFFEILYPIIVHKLTVDL